MEFRYSCSQILYLAVPALSSENRTNVRSGKSSSFEQSPVLGRLAPLFWARLGLRVLGTMAPPLAVRIAERLFMTPPAGRPTLAGAPGAARLAPEPHLFTVRANVVDLSVSSWGDGPVVLLQHGWGGRSEDLAAFVRSLLDPGFSVIAPDAPGHGRSGGGDSSIVAFADAL